MQLAVAIFKVNPLRKLYNKLCRELAQSERFAATHVRREARRLGDTPPARALRALGGHAQAMCSRLDGVEQPPQPIGVLAGRKVGELFLVLRYFLFARLIHVERSYRGTLLGFHESLSIGRLLRDVAERLDEQEMVGFCEQWLEQREPLLAIAERELHWFADTPRQAIRPGFRMSALRE